MLDPAALMLLDLGIIIIVATVLAYFARLLKQPVILAYMVAGVIIGPAALGLITNQALIWTFSELGIAFLLFIVGLELDLRKLKEVGLNAAIIGFGQIFFSFIAALGIALAFGFTLLEAMYISLALTLSSTMIVVKLLSDKRELDTLHGRIILGVLLIQDVIAILALAMLMTTEAISPPVIALSLLKGIGLFAIAVLFGKFVLPLVFDFVAKSGELLFLSAISWCIGFAIFSNLLGFSFAIGAFLAGIALASLPYNIEIIAKVRSLKDFFATIFFVSLGMLIAIGNVANILVPILVFSLFVIVGNILIIMVLCGLRRYGKRTSFLTGISLAQISEFSLILVIQAFALKQITQEIVSIIAIVAVITITMTSYLIKYDEEIYRKVSKYLNVFERRHEHKIRLPKKKREHVILFGCHRTGYKIVKTLQKLGENFLVVDYNPEIINALYNKGINCMYGDLGDAEVLERVNLRKARVIISTIPSVEDNEFLLEETRKNNPRACVILTATRLGEALELYDKEADYVILPNYLSGEKAASLIRETMGKKSCFAKIKSGHVSELEKMREEEILSKHKPLPLSKTAEKLEKEKTQAKRRGKRESKTAKPKSTKS